MTMQLKNNVLFLQQDYPLTLCLTRLRAAGYCVCASPNTGKLQRALWWTNYETSAHYMFEWCFSRLFFFFT